MAGDAPVVYEHYRLSGDDAPIFRVVGVGVDDADADDRVTLLRVTDDAGNREATGDLRHVDRERFAREFEPAQNPDPRFETPDYLAGLMLLAGVGLALHPAGDRLTGAVLALGGGYFLWRRH